MGKTEMHISIDIDADGPAPENNSMLSISGEVSS